MQCKDVPYKNLYRAYMVALRTFYLILLAWDHTEHAIDHNPAFPYLLKVVAFESKYDFKMQ